MPNRPRFIGLVIAVALAAASLTAVAVAAQSPKERLASILARARAQRSVHYVSWASEGAAGHLSVTADVGRSRGVAHLEQTLMKRSSSITVIVVGNTAYVRGGKNGLEDFVSLSPAKAARYAGRWISIPKGTKTYQYEAEGARLRSFFHAIRPAPHSRVEEASTTFERRRVAEIRALASNEGGETDFFLQPGGRLPIDVRYVAAGGMGGSTLSRWNERIRVRPPASSVPIAIVRR